MSGLSLNAVNEALKPFSNKYRKSSTKTLRVNNNAGCPVSSVREEKLVFRDHFAGQQSGVSMPFSHIISLDRSDLANLRFPSYDFKYFIDSIPLPSCIMSQFALTDPSKTWGEDPIVGILLKKFPKLFTSVLYPVLLKSYFYMAPPIQWKGGMLHELFKNKGSSAEKECYRDIMLGSIPGKKCFKPIRSKLIPFAASIVGLSQFGSGFNGGETAFAHLYLRLVYDYARKINSSAGVLFLDVSSAFATLLRRIIFNTSDGDEAWLKQLHNSGFSCEDVSHIWNSVTNFNFHQQNDSILHCGSQQFSFLYMQNSYFNTWFSQESLEGAVRTSRGCLAGMTFADIVYSMCFAPVLKLLRASLVQSNIGAYCYSNGSKVPLHEAAFADDVIIPVMSKAPSLTSNLCQVAKNAIVVFNAYGLQLNFLPGKSEALPLFLGSGANKAKLSLQQSNFSISLAPEHSMVCLRFVFQYKHMGSLFAVNYDANSEVAVRSAYIIKGAKKFSAIFKNPRVPVQRKINIAKAHILTGGSYQCNTWPELGVRSFLKFHHAILAVYRMATGTQIHKDFDGNPFSDGEVITKYNLLSLIVIIRLARISLFFRVCSKNVIIVKHLLFALASSENGWVKALKNDLMWFSLSPNAPRLSGISQYLNTPAPMFKSYKSTLNTYAKSPFANLDAHLHHPELVGPDPSSSYICSNCLTSKPTKQSCNLHMFKCFGYKDPIRIYIEEHVTTCEVCLIQFWTRERLLNHL